MSDKPATQKTGLRELWGIILLTLSLLMGLALYSYEWGDILLWKTPPNDPPLNYIGPVGAWFGCADFFVIGLGAWLLPPWAALLGFLLLLRPEDRLWTRCLWGLAIITTFGLLLDIHPAWFPAAAAAVNIEGMAGGLLGWLAGREFLERFLGHTGADVLAGGLLAAGVVMFLGVPFLRRAFAVCLEGCRYLKARLDLAVESRRDRIQTIAREERDIEKQKTQLEKAIQRHQQLADRDTVPKETESRAKKSPPPPEPPPPKPAPEKRVPEKPALERVAAEKLTLEKVPAEKPAAEKKGTVPRPAVPLSSSPDSSYRLPPVTLLNEINTRDRNIENDWETTARILEATLADFSIDCKVTNYKQGPTVTRYELLPAAGVRVEKIAGLQQNLQLALKANGIRIQAPIPGKGVVGIEVPNSATTKVFLREILEGETWRNATMELPLVLGKDVAGNDLVVDLTDMPHLLIAGATGSGKTVCMNSLLAGLLMSRTPEELRLILVDPKYVEFSMYNNLPHLAVPVITDPKKVVMGLRWAINEMDKRYSLFEKVGVKKIQAFNARPIPATPPGTPATDEPTIPTRLPYVVVIVDELADLMQVAQKADVETSIQRLAQRSRAAGLHLILATQRPSVDVITGTIKANFPARISFQVAQKVDSRTILDKQGAEILMGRGDMLFLPGGSGKFQTQGGLVRAQGSLIVEDEIQAIVKFIKDQRPPQFVAELKKSMDSAGPGGEGILDEKTEAQVAQAVEIIRMSGKASISYLQRRLGIGYNRAATLIEILEERNIVGEDSGSGTREILIDMEGRTPENEPQPAETEEDADGDRGTNTQAGP